MTRRLAIAAWALAAAPIVLACGRGGDVAARGAPLRGTEAAPVPQGSDAHDHDAHADDGLVLDRRGDGATLRGVPVPLPPETDADRVLVLQAELQGRAIDPTLDGARVLDARFVGARAVVTVGADHVLRVHEDGAAIELDRDVEAPLSVSGTVLAYGRGDMPFFELARADVATRTTSAWTSGMAPVWSPALSADGREAIFVSGASGAPRLHRIGANGVATALAEAAAFPSSLRAPRWEGGTLRFEDESGRAWSLEVATGRLAP